MQAMLLRWAGKSKKRCGVRHTSGVSRGATTGVDGSRCPGGVLAGIHGSSSSTRDTAGIPVRIGNRVSNTGERTTGIGKTGIVTPTANRQTAVAVIMVSSAIAVRTHQPVVTGIPRCRE